MQSLAGLKAGLSDQQRALADENREQLKRDLQQQVRAGSPALAGPSSGSRRVSSDHCYNELSDVGAQD